MKLEINIPNKAVLVAITAVVLIAATGLAVASGTGQAILFQAAPAQYHPPGEIWPQGSGSALDADLLDGIDSHELCKADGTDCVVGSGAIGAITVIEKTHTGDMCPAGSPCGYVAPGYWFKAVAACPAGQKLISGGCKIEGAEQCNDWCPAVDGIEITATMLWQNYPDVPNNSWVCGAKNNEGVVETAILTAYALCVAE